jgi:hypothetical protein
MGHQLFYPQLNFDTFKDGPARKKLDNKKLYGQSKFVSRASLICNSPD